MNELKNNQLQKILSGIVKCGNVKDQLLKSVLVHNFRTISTEFKNLKESRTKPDGWDNYQSQLDSLNDIYMIGKHSTGSPNYGENFDDFNRAFTQLRLDNKDMIAENRKLIEDFNNRVMNQPIAINLKFINEKDLPKELNVEQVLGIEDIIIFEADKEDN